MRIETQRVVRKTLVGLNVYGKASQRKERIEKGKILKEDDESCQERKRRALGQLEQEADDAGGQDAFEEME